MFGLGTTELVVILVIVIIVFGASRLPALGKGLGEGLRNFREAFRSGGATGEEGKKNSIQTGPGGSDNKDPPKS